MSNFTIIAQEVTRKTSSTHFYKGVITFTERPDKNAVIDSIDCCNWGGCISYHATTQPNVFEFSAEVYID
jgi:hypothetical protein